MTTKALNITLGYLFEVGFNLGILTYIEQSQLKHHYGDFYRQHLENLNLTNIVRKLANDNSLINYQDRKTLEKWCLFFLQKSFLSGLNFFKEYLTAIGWNKRPSQIEILYYQCCFWNDNSLSTYERDKYEEWEKILSQLGKKASNIDLESYTHKGEFLNADTLILMSYRKQVKLLSIDYSIFGFSGFQDFLDIENVENLRRLLLKEIRYLKSKSIFAKLGLDSQTIYDDFDQSLSRYYTAFKTKDKETVKLIQAGSYAYSFSQWLQKIGFFDDNLTLTYHLVGYSDRNISAMTLNHQNASILKTCYHIYTQESRDKTIIESRQEILKYIRRNAVKSFDQGKKFIDQLLNISPNKVNVITHQECLTDFQNINEPLSPDLAQSLNLDLQLTLRDAHAKLIQRFLSAKASEIYLFLTGNPGIGKTTAITEFLKEDTQIKEGFLLFYVSPRTQVNLDIINKFKLNEDQNTLSDDRLFTLTTNATLIEQNKGQYTVNYVSNQYTDSFIENTVHFIPQSQEIESHSFRSSLKRQTEDTLHYTGYTGKGVLESICQGIYTLIHQSLSNNIIATVAIQALKKTRNGDTLFHLRKIFKDVYNCQTGNPIPSEMTKLSSRIKHLIFMIDEITGDDGGVEFLSGITKLLQEYDLTNKNYGFNVKIIIADASIMDQNVIQQHLSETSPEPNKIFFRKGEHQPLPLSFNTFLFKNKPSVIVNANSYPAKTLTLNYQILIQCSSLRDRELIKPKLELEKQIQKKILQDILALMSKLSSSQIIVYIQDKQHLYELIEKLQEKLGNFAKYVDYLEIHASLGEQEKKEIHQHKNKVKVIFMTASASRGLSFPKVKHIFVDIPHFEIEQNLMEIIQVIYRGRGYYENHQTLDQDDKYLTFYLSEQIIEYLDPEDDQTPEQKQISVTQGVLNILNILIILKTAIMTRIIGQGKIGSDQVMMIPIGGKSVTTVGQTFSGVISSLIHQLKKEGMKYPEKRTLKELSTTLENLLETATFLITKSPKNRENPELSYLKLTETLQENFYKAVSHCFADLLQFKPLQTSYLQGSLLLIPLENQSIEETYRLQFQQSLSPSQRQEILNKLLQIQYDLNTPNSLKIAIKDAVKLMDLLQEKLDKIQQFEQQSNYDDQYYLLPLFMFIVPDSLKDYFSQSSPEPEDKRFHDLFRVYLRLMYPAINILPIGYQYKDFPFLLFRSYSLKELRTKRFTEKYFLTSHELNILNLMLLKD